MNTTTLCQFAAFTFSFAVGTLSACHSNSESDPATDSGLNPLFACVDQDFMVGKPLESELFQPAAGGLVAPTQESYIVHTTQVFVPPESVGDFFDYLGPIVAQLESTPGLIAYSVSSDAGCGDYRTMGIWESEEAMYKFVASGAHAEVLTVTDTLTEAGRVVHWKADVEEVNALTWDVAKAKIAGVPELSGY